MYVVMLVNIVTFFNVISGIIECHIYIIWASLMFSSDLLLASSVQAVRIVVLLAPETQRQSHLWTIFDIHLQFPIVKHFLVMKN